MLHSALAIVEVRRYDSVYLVLTLVPFFAKGARLSLAEQREAIHAYDTGTVLS